MKKYFRAFIMCVSMFCSIPCPIQIWDEESRPLMILFLPFVGAWIGVLWAAAAYLTGLIPWLPVYLRAALLCAFPFILTGGMHLDGFMDVTDAIRSCRDVEERRKILKDPNAGSFAVIDTVLLVLFQFAAFCSLDGTENVFALILIPTATRCAAAVCGTVLNPMSTSEYSGRYREGIKKSHVVFLAAVAAIAAALGIVFLKLYAVPAAAAAAGYLLYAHRGVKSLGGMSGDISGYALTFGELCGILAFALI